MPVAYLGFNFGAGGGVLHSRGFGECGIPPWKKGAGGPPGKTFKNGLYLEAFLATLLELIHQTCYILTIKFMFLGGNTYTLFILLSL